MLFKLVLFSIFAFTYCFSVNQTTDNELEHKWLLFKYNFSKVYESETEERIRFNVFEDNLKKIERHNLEASLKLKSHNLKVNKFSDLLPNEINSMINGHKSRTNRSSFGLKFVRNESLVLPDSVDWRKKGYVTPVKDQKNCGSSWAFSATGSLEGQSFRKTNKIVSLSEQQLIDCSREQGCGGGSMRGAFEYLKINKGIDTQDYYPYIADESWCKYLPDKVGANFTGYVEIKSGDEEELKEAVATIGPISVAINAELNSFLFYHTGVYYEHICNRKNLNLGVLVVGYGTTDDGKDYWIVKNSWGTDWGDSGYILMSRNKDNNCGIASNALYPLV